MPITMSAAFCPSHIYDTATGRPVAVILRPGKTPSGIEVRRWLRRLIKRIRQHWPVTRITIRGDGHYGRDKAMSWCEDHGVDYIFGFGGNAALDRLVEGVADDIRTRRAEGKLAILRGYAETRYAAKSWTRERRVAARIEAKESDEDDMLRRGLDVRYVVTSLNSGSAEHIYAAVYCARGQAENLIKQHKAQTASDRTSCRSPLANQVRLILHTAAYWLLLDVRDHVPSWHPLRQSEFSSIRLHLLKVAGRIVRRQAASVLHWPRAVRRPHCSVLSHSGCNSPGHERRGAPPLEPISPTSNA